MTVKKVKGIVTRIESKSHFVLCENGDLVECSLPGRIKKLYRLKRDKLTTKDIVAVGDEVVISLSGNGLGVIDEIGLRENFLSRKAPFIKGRTHRGERLEQIIAANLTRLFVVTSILDPEFNNRTLDRFLVTAASCKIAVTIIINKIDLDEDGEHEFWYQVYENLGYDILTVSAHRGDGIEQLKARFDEGTFLFWGPSGVGKSTLLNTCFPQLDLKTAEISEWSKKGTHTTVTSEMYEIDDSLFIVDTPGIREIEPYGLQKIDLGHYFVEFEDYIHDCKYNTCTHVHEPGCAVLEAVENEEILAERYESYVRLLETIEDGMIYI